MSRSFSLISGAFALRIRAFGCGNDFTPTENLVFCTNYRGCCGETLFPEALAYPFRMFGGGIELAVGLEQFILAFRPSQGGPLAQFIQRGIRQRLE